MNIKRPIEILRYVNIMVLLIQKNFSSSVDFICLQASISKMAARFNVFLQRQSMRRNQIYMSMEAKMVLSVVREFQLLAFRYWVGSPMSAL